MGKRACSKSVLVEVRGLLFGSVGVQGVLSVSAHPRCKTPGTAVGVQGVLGVRKDKAQDARDSGRCPRCVRCKKRQGARRHG